MTKELTPYEKARLENIELNKELLASLEIGSAKRSLNATEVITVKKRKRAPVNSVKKEQSVIQIRKSSRIRGEKALEITLDDHEAVKALDEAVKQDPRYAEMVDAGKLLTADEYFPEDIKAKAIRVDGHFKGWVNPEIMEKYGLASSATEAWEENGGGTYSYADPTGSGKKRKKGPSNAKAEALKMFKKNPNQYFYRHNEPGEEQWMHDWSEEEKQLFLKVAKMYGCGDKWGLFASYIPHRFGYQCSSFYRHDIIQNGLVFDPNFQFTPSGEPVYIGNQRSHK
ncbi:hypothetical protein EDC96DRAFT_532933 [Choanephora cucurbitarum]|nr:hypothetical protein EDC96DRAFT_532933 [Choanephora cucurbitarum]